MSQRRGEQSLLKAKASPEVPPSLGDVVVVVVGKGDPQTLLYVSRETLNLDNIEIK